MPVVTLKKGYFTKLIGGKIADKTLEGEIAKLGLNVESIDANEISIEVMSNRPDLLSAVGIARALRYFMHKSSKFDYEIKDNAPAAVITVGKKVSEVRPFIAALTVTNLELTNDSLTELLGFIEKFCETYGRNRRKIAIGLHDISKVDIKELSYDLYDDTKFLPLNEKEEAYFSKIIKMMDKGIKYSDTILGGRKGFPALKDSKGVMALIPIINSERTKVTTSTKSLLVDITGTSDYLVRRTADLLAALFVDMDADVGKVKIQYKDTSYLTPELEKVKMEIPVTKVEDTIGAKIGPNNSASLASKMGYSAAFMGTKLEVTLPPYRLDIINEQDVIEDIAIGYGYDYIRPASVKSEDAGALEELTIIRYKLEEAMLGMEFNQMMNSYLSNEEVNFTKMRLYNDENYIRIKDPKAAAITMLRTWVLPSLLKNGGMSQSEKMPQRMFELDMAFVIKNNEIIENYSLAAVSTDSKANFNYIKAVLQALSESFNFKFTTEALAHASFIDGRCAKISVNGVPVGFFGELHPEVLNNFGIEEPTVAFEMDISFLVKKEND